eukprot:TRINITY_DN765_c0_g2_i2.p1 TRINITY_DN765_c0_g2~~TRINITY_DN765_c0_g2_i2.p1  ORF type:complete len:634 (-),score=113.15 TRINITY_DN765_c0_g2_i2:305-2206(-)
MYRNNQGINVNYVPTREHSPFLKVQQTSKVPTSITPNQYRPIPSSYQQTTPTQAQPSSFTTTATTNGNFQPSSYNSRPVYHHVTHQTQSQSNRVTTSQPYYQIPPQSYTSQAPLSNDRHSHSTNLPAQRSSISKKDVEDSNDTRKMLMNFREALNNLSDVLANIKQKYNINDSDGDLNSSVMKRNLSFNGLHEIVDPANVASQRRQSFQMNEDVQTNTKSRPPQMKQLHKRTRSFGQNIDPNKEEEQSFLAARPHNVPGHCAENSRRLEKTKSKDRSFQAERLNNSALDDRLDNSSFMSNNTNNKSFDLALAPPRSRAEKDRLPQQNSQNSGHRRTSSFGEQQQISILQEIDRFNSRRSERASLDKASNPSKEEVSRSEGIQVTYAWRSRTGYDPTISGGKTNQDSYIVSPNLFGSQSRHFFCVNDGHGLNGHLVSTFLKDQMPVFLSRCLPKSGNAKIALISTFEMLNKSLHDSDIDITFSGSTSVSILINKESIFCSNVGDSRAILGQFFLSTGWEHTALSNDHKPSVKAESDRIVRNGGRIEPFYDSRGNTIGPPRVWLLNEDKPGLAMTRSLGDKVASSVGVSWVPEIIEHRITSQDKFLILATDGIWEFLSNEDVNISFEFRLANSCL